MGWGLPLTTGGTSRLPPPEYPNTSRRYIITQPWKSAAGNEGVVFSLGCYSTFRATSSQASSSVVGLSRACFPPLPLPSFCPSGGIVDADGSRSASASVALTAAPTLTGQFSACAKTSEPSVSRPKSSFTNASVKVA